MTIRNAMEQWNHSINSVQGNLRNTGGSAPALYKASAQVTQFSKTGDILRIYNFVGLYPSEVSTIDLAWDAETIQEFTVTFQYDYWEVSGGTTGNAGGIN